MRTLILIAAVIVAACAFVPSDEVETRRAFLQFQRDYNKTYDNAAEHEKRYTIFKANVATARKLTVANNYKARFGVTQFMDLSPEEFAGMYLTARVPKDYKAPPPHNRQAVRHNVHVNVDPTNYDWNSAGVITPVYNQEQCGSCWAFSATETIESYWALAGNQLTQLSMEQIVDCDTSDNGCGGGMPSSAYGYVESAGGLESYSEYPYSAGGGQAGQCNFNSQYIVASMSNYASIDGESGLYQQLSASNGGPVSVCVDASTWQYYNGGVLTQCGNTIDHCVQATGYANYGQSGAYWIVRNSWGTGWGESGYIWVAIGQDLCGIGDQATVVSC